MPRFTNTFHRFGKYDPLYHGTEKYSLTVLTTDSIIKNNSLIAFSTKEKNNLKFQEHEIINGNTILSSLILKKLRACPKFCVSIIHSELYLKEGEQKMTKKIKKRTWRNW
ncbi:hypothetical protein [Spiroplasma endosymbiont of Clivina fossor]|uniref:hypothetical protein n=1 Tax=Spiroplasma endosymbiont of Clivina fossor TaxID=3066282 RepID=UPI00313B588F